MANVKKEVEAVKEEKTVDLSDIQAQMNEMMKLLKEKDKQIEELKKVTENTENTLNENDYVGIKSVVDGTLVVKTRNDKFVFTESGQTEEVKFGELKSLRNSSSAYFTEPLIVVNNEEAIKRLGLQRQYEEMAFLNDLPKFFNSNHEDVIIEKLNKLPHFTLMQVLKKLKDLYAKKEFTDVEVRELIKEKYSYDIFEK